MFLSIPSGLISTSVSLIGDIRTWMISWLKGVVAAPEKASDNLTQIEQALIIFSLSVFYTQQLSPSLREEWILRNGFMRKCHKHLQSMTLSLFLKFSDLHDPQPKHLYNSSQSKSPTQNKLCNEDKESYH